MGTRADFYLGRGLAAVWLGSIAWDGYPSGIPEDILGATDDVTFRERVETFIANRKDGTKPEMGWPWPWDDSQTTDFAYAIDGGKVYASCFGHDWYDPLEPEPEEHSDIKSTVFPNMRGRKNVTYGERSGVMIFGVRG